MCTNCECGVNVYNKDEVDQQRETKLYQTSFYTTSSKNRCLTNHFFFFLHVEKERATAKQYETIETLESSPVRVCRTKWMWSSGLIISRARRFIMFVLFIYVCLFFFVSPILRLVKLIYKFAIRENRREACAQRQYIQELICTSKQHYVYKEKTLIHTKNHHL